MKFEVGQVVGFGYNGKNRLVKIEQVGKAYIQGRVETENNLPKTFSLKKMVGLIAT